MLVWWYTPFTDSYSVQEYLARLQAIRQQNYQERKRIQQRYSSNEDRKEEPPPSGPPLQLDPDERRRRIAALKVGHCLCA